MAKKDLKKGKKDSKKGGAKGKKAAAKAAPPKQRAKAAPEVIEPLLMDVGAAGGAATAVAAPADDGTVDDSGPKAQEIATFLGVELSKFLTTDQIQKLRRGLPGYTNVLDDASVQLKKYEKQLDRKSTRLNSSHV